MRAMADTGSARYPSVQPSIAPGRTTAGESAHELIEGVKLSALYRALVKYRFRNALSCSKISLFDSRHCIEGTIPGQRHPLGLYTQLRNLLCHQGRKGLIGGWIFLTRGRRGRLLAGLAAQDYWSGEAGQSIRSRRNAVLRTDIASLHVISRG